MSEEIVNGEVVAEEVVPVVTEALEDVEDVEEAIEEEAPIVEEAIEEEAPIVEEVISTSVVERLGRFDAEGSEEVKFSDGTTGFFKS